VGVGDSNTPHPIMRMVQYNLNNDFIYTYGISISLFYDNQLPNYHRRIKIPKGHNLENDFEKSKKNYFHIYPMES